MRPNKVATNLAGKYRCKKGSIVCNNNIPPLHGAVQAPNDYYENLVVPTNIAPCPRGVQQPEIGNTPTYFLPFGGGREQGVQVHGQQPPILSPPIANQPVNFPPPQIRNPPFHFDPKIPDIPRKFGNTNQHAMKQLSSRNKKKSSKKEKDYESGQDDEFDYANRPIEESPQLNVPSEGLVEFFLANHTLNKKKLQKEFDSILDYTRLVYNFMSNPTKNRFNNVLCFNEGSVKLKVTKPEEGEYIHASHFITKEGSYIMTQAPLPNTLEDFWRLIWQENVSVVVSFVDFTNLDECTEYFNVKKGKKKTIGRFSIKTNEIENFGEYNGFFLKITTKGEEEQRDIAVVQWLNWNVDQLVDTTGLINFMQIVWNLEKIGKEPKFSPKLTTLVHGTSGTRRTGTFVVLSLICKQLFLKKKCNLISTALLVRKYRHNVLRDKNMFAALLLGMIKFSTNIKLLKKDKKYIEKVEQIIKSALLAAPPVGKKVKGRHKGQKAK